jgi:hypothetical protein
MYYTEFTYTIYLAVSVALTVWVARTLHRNGRVFLVDAFHGNETLADSVNHLLVVGFYLINIGYVTLALKYGAKPHNVQEAIEFLSTKVGLVLVVLGVMHFGNLLTFSRMRRRAAFERQFPPTRGISAGLGSAVSTAMGVPPLVPPVRPQEFTGPPVSM